MDAMFVLNEGLLSSSDEPGAAADMVAVGKWGQFARYDGRPDEGQSEHFSIACCHAAILLAILP